MFIKSAAFWVVYAVAVALAVIHWLIELVLDGFDFILTRLEKLLQHLEH